jgi:hypothetical protein
MDLRDVPSSALIVELSRRDDAQSARLLAHLRLVDDNSARRNPPQPRPPANRRDLRTSARARQWVEVLAREVAGTRAVPQPQGPPQFSDMQPDEVEYLWWTGQFYSMGFLTVVSADSLRRFDSPIDAVNAYIQQSGMPEPFDNEKRILYTAMLTALAPLV